MKEFFTVVQTQFKIWILYLYVVIKKIDIYNILQLESDYLNLKWVIVYKNVYQMLSGIVIIINNKHTSET